MLIQLEIETNEFVAPKCRRCLGLCNTFQTEADGGWRNGLWAQCYTGCHRTISTFCKPSKHLNLPFTSAHDIIFRPSRVTLTIPPMPTENPAMDHQHKPSDTIKIADFPHAQEVDSESGSGQSSERSDRLREIWRRNRMIIKKIAKLYRPAR